MLWVRVPPPKPLMKRKRQHIPNETFVENRVIFVGDASIFKNSKYADLIYYGVKGEVKIWGSSQEYKGENTVEFLFRPLNASVWFPVLKKEIRLDKGFAGNLKLNIDFSLYED